MRRRLSMRLAPCRHCGAPRESAGPGWGRLTIATCDCRVRRCKDRHVFPCYYLPVFRRPDGSLSPRESAGPGWGRLITVYTSSLFLGVHYLNGANRIAQLWHGPKGELP